MNNAEVADAWARGVLRCATGSNFWSSNESLYSYHTLIGCRVVDSLGRVVVLLTNEGHSHTTQRHRSLAYSAAQRHGRTIYYVPQSTLTNWPYGPYTAAIEHYITEAQAYLLKARRATKNKQFWTDQTIKNIEDAQSFAEAFELDVELPDELAQLVVPLIDLT